MEIGRHFRDEQRIVGVCERLILPGEIRVHRVTQFVGERAHAGHFICITHHDEWVCSLRTRGERAMSLALIRVHIHPAILETAPADCVNIFAAHRREAFADQLDAFFEGNLHFLPRNGSPHIVIGELF